MSSRDRTSGISVGTGNSGLSKALDSSLKQLSPRPQNQLSLKEEVLGSSQPGAFSQGHLQKVSKENVPLSQPRSVSEKLKLAPSVSKSPAHIHPAKKQKLQPYVLIPTVSHSVPSKKHKPSVSTSKIGPPPAQNGTNVLAAALFQQFSHNNTASDGAKVSPAAQLAPSLPGPPRSHIRKRSFSKYECTPDELLLGSEVCVPTAGPSPRITKASNENSGNPVLEEAPSSPTDLLKIGDGDHSFSIGLEADAQPAAVPNGDDDASVSQSQAEEAWKGPPCHAFAPKPPVHRSAYYRRRELAILEKALADGKEKEKAGVGCYNPPVGWQELCRVPGRLPHVTRSETRAQRYTEILERAYGPGDVRRGHGRKPYKMKAALPRLDVSSEDESDDESVADVGRREDVPSDTSMTDAPITPPDEPLLSGKDGNAGAPSAPIIVDGNDEPLEQHPFAERESLLVPEPISAHAPFGTVDPRKLTCSVPATEPQPTPADLVAVATSELGSLQIAPDAQSVPVTITERSNSASSPPQDPLPPVHHIRWFNPEEWKAAFRRLVSGKKQAAIEDLLSVNQTITSLEEMIEALPGETIVQSLVQNIAGYLLQMKDLPDDFIPFGDQFNLRKRSADVLRAAYGVNGPTSTL